MGNVVNKMAFVPPVPTYLASDVNMWLDTEKGNRIPAFHIKNGNKFTFLVSHANAEDLGISLPFWLFMSNRLNIDVFAYEYSGYGRSIGTPASEDNLGSDVKAAFNCMRDVFKLVPADNIILYGKSLGSCPSCDICAKEKVKGVILVSGIASGARVLFPNIYVSAPLLDLVVFNNMRKLASNKSPVQVIHGDSDEVVPFVNGQMLYDTVKRRGCHPLAPVWISGGHHNDVETQFMDAYLQGISKFLEHLKKN